MKLSVKSAVIDWPAQTLEITERDGGKHAIPLWQNSIVTMIGYPERVQKTLMAGNLDYFTTKGYSIEEIEVLEEPSETEEDTQPHTSEQLPDIDLEHIVRMWPAAMAIATKMRREEDTDSYDR